VTAPVWFHLLAGPNGAGKSTLYRALRADGLVERSADFVNADLHERDHLRHIVDDRRRSEAARAWADARRAELLAQGLPLVSETVFSHPSKIDLIRDAKARGHTVALHVVALDDPQRLPARVAQRVREGGHAVPPERILARYPRTLEHLRQAVPLADVAYLYDARDVEDGGPRLVAVHAGGRTTWVDPPAPAWARTMLPDADGG
jgi:predicted ABC-type ATPase